MSDSNLILSLAKVLIAAAWADGEVTNDEINALKDLLFQLPNLNARDWAALDIYIDSPIDPNERNRLVAELQAAIITPSDKELAKTTLDSIIQADGILAPEERAAAEVIQAAIDHVSVNVFAQMGKLMRLSMHRRDQSVSETSNREHHLEDFLRNRVYYKVRRRMDQEQIEIDLPDAELRKLGLAGGLLARVAHVDEQVTDEEFATIVQALRNGWNLSPEHATLVAETALATFERGLDFYRTSREFFAATNEAERIRFVNTLFDVAAADDKLSHEETEEIRTIAFVLKLTHKQFIDAKMHNQV